MSSIFCVYKPVGYTPLEVVQQVRDQYPDLRDSVLSYAGRLDPMADGMLLILSGEANTKRKSYERLDKTYQFEIVFGVSTDSYDLLGIPSDTLACARGIKREATEESPDSLSDLSQKTDIWLQKKAGTFIQAYPPYSSARVNGKPLFWWAREGRLGEILIPEKEVTLVYARVLSERSILLSDLVSYLESCTKTLSGQFRQSKITEAWHGLLQRSGDYNLPAVTVEAKVSGGLYIRSLCNEIGQEFGCGAIARKITRTVIGEGFEFRELRYDVLKTD